MTHTRDAAPDSEARVSVLNPTPWHHDARWRLLIAIIVGAGVVVPVALALNVIYAILLGWSVVALTFCTITWLAIFRMGADETRTHARREIPGEPTVFILLTLAALASLGGIAFLIFRPTNRIADAGVCLLVIISSWMTVQTMHVLRYAREYYATDPGSGMDFHSPDKPQYSDFAYVAFTVGMSFAVSDTDMNTSRMRRIALGHALLAYLFGTVFVAALVNILASLSG